MEDPSKKFIAEFVDQLAVPEASDTYIIAFLNRSSIIEKGRMGTLKATYSL